MCGITGVLYSQPKLNHDDFLSLMNGMGSTLKHRGPDDHGEWVDANNGIGLAHTRLSIIDLSNAGRQPMKSKNNRYVIIFNGEIYNYLEIRSELEKSGISFKGRSDTETLLESINFFGLEKALNRINGMFAFALWDRENRTLTLACDRFGKKPIYYGWCEDVFMFGSELKALKQHPSFNGQINRKALSQFIQYTWLSGSSSIFSNISKLQAGTYLEVYQSNIFDVKQPLVYWSAIEKAKIAQLNNSSDNYLSSVNRLDELLNLSVKKRMIADVELGALLSGGIDSSLVVSIMQANSENKIKTFSVGYEEETHNEAVYAKNIAKFLGTKHEEIYITEKECMDVIPKLAGIYDEPFADVSQIPTYLVSHMASEHVKVALTGDGGDELFAGYTRYFRCQRHWDTQQKTPKFIKRALGSLMESSANQLWNLFTSSSNNQSLVNLGKYADKLDKRSRRICASNSTELFIMMMQRYNNIDELVIGGSNSSLLFSAENTYPCFQDEILNMMLVDATCYLSGDILVKVDRASMANSLEVRSPLLDKEVAEFAWGLPESSRYDSQGGKKILKDVLSRYVPRELTQRKKMGFGVPIGDWLRSFLKDWASDLLNENRISQQGYFNYKVVNKIWSQHQSGWRDHSKILWAILMFQMWLKEQSI